ncbi:hypothetical protein L798_00336 [Zootermopsis nevadensis]|uniref:Uncharacterized protein n=1 Tax=Zootermopsis nevadensis TaxID=136037 RepID=A0A067QL68_ZOONE|nr:hypothetical protein L798_00336 [Zootermopsis nevadensis]
MCMREFFPACRERQSAAWHLKPSVWSNRLQMLEDHTRLQYNCAIYNR